VRPLTRLSILSVVAALVGGAGCHSDYRSTVTLPEDCDRQFFFEDVDGDGWGDPEGAYELRCQADEANNLTARNNLDCDDADDGVTGRTAAICPDELVAGGAAYLAFGASGAEIAAVLPTDDFSHIGSNTVETTDLIWPDGGESACGEVGWGGGLATFANLTELTEVTDELDEIVGGDFYAAWVGLVPNDDNTAFVWDGVDGAGLDINEVGICNPDDKPDATDTQDPGRRMALVKREGQPWCFGFPSDANPATVSPGVFQYTRREANFICERSPPRAADFAIDRDPAGG